MLSQSELVGVTTITAHVGIIMSSKVAKRNAEIAGGEKVAKQRPLRRRIRDTVRLLSREDLPETVRQTKERILKSLKQELAEKLDEKRSKKRMKVHRMVKFFEKRKVMRMLKTKMKLYGDCPAEKKLEMEEAIARLRLELNYIEYYPETLKYQSLYPSTETTSAKGIARRESMLANTAERVTSGELPDVSQELCSSLEGRSFEHIAELARIMRTRDDVAVEEEEEEEGVEGKKKKKTHKSSNRIKSRKTAPVDEEPDSDWEVDPSKDLSKDDFFLDTTGNL